MYLYIYICKKSLVYTLPKTKIIKITSVNKLVTAFSLPSTQCAMFWPSQTKGNHRNRNAVISLVIAQKCETARMTFITALRPKIAYGKIPIASEIWEDNLIMWLLL